MLQEFSPKLEALRSNGLAIRIKIVTILRRDFFDVGDAMAVRHGDDGPGDRSGPRQDTRSNKPTTVG